MYKAALFDLDGTLADTFGDIAASVNRFLTVMGYPTRTPEDILTAISFGRREFLRRSLPHPVSEEEMDRCLACYTQIYQQHYMDTTAPYPGMPQLIASLQKTGLKVAVVTNKAHPNALHMVETIFPADLFAVIRGLSDLPAKPDPALALAVAEELGVAPAECAFIGDSELDMQTARNAGMTPIGVSWGYRPTELLVAEGASAIAHSPEELGELLLAQ